MAVGWSGREGHCRRTRRPRKGGPILSAILIDPEARTLVDIRVERTLDAIKHAMQVRYIDAWANRTLAIMGYADDEGLLNLEHGESLTLIHGFVHPLAKRLLVCGLPDQHGDETNCPLTAAELSAFVRFVPAADLGYRTAPPNDSAPST